MTDSLALTSAEIAAAITACRRLMELWCLDPLQAARVQGNIGSWTRWQAEPGSIPEDVLRRMGKLLRIHMYLKSIMPDVRHHAGWLVTEHQALGDRSPMYMMLSDESGVDKVEAYVSAQLALDYVLVRHVEAFRELAKR